MPFWNKTKQRLLIIPVGGSVLVYTFARLQIIDTCAMSPFKPGVFPGRAKAGFCLFLTSFRVYRLQGAAKAAVLWKEDSFTLAIKRAGTEARRANLLSRYIDESPIRKCGRWCHRTGFCPESFFVVPCFFKGSCLRNSIRYTKASVYFGNVSNVFQELLTLTSGLWTCLTFIPVSHFLSFLTVATRFFGKVRGVFR